MASRMGTKSHFKTNHLPRLSLFQFGTSPAKSACATLQVERRPSDKAIQKLKALDTVYGVEISQI